MGLWGGSRQKESVEEQEMALAHKIASREREKARFISEAKSVGRVARSVSGPQARQAVGFETGRAVITGMQQRPTFSREQQMLGEMFGHGERIWGNVGEPVRINNDLNSSRSDPYDETSSMFGWGGQSERSGLF